MDMARTAALIPEAALKKHIAILGTNGSGKTSGQLRTLGIIDYPSPGRIAMEGWVFDVL